MSEPVRLQRYLAAAGVAARRKAEELITAGRVQVNGEVVTTLGTKIDPDHDQVEVDGQAVVALDAFYVLLNKPKGCITAVTDDRGRPTVMDYLPNLPVPVKPVGRLDFYSEGVLLLTNDGELAARLLAPASHVPKTYHVKVHGKLSPDQVRALRHGVTLDDGTTTLPAEVEILPGESKHTWLGITIHEGKHRQIHRMIEALGYRVDKLQRVAFANLTFHNLRVGDARELTQQELNELRDAVGLPHDRVARGKWHSQREDTDIPRRARAKARAEAEALAAETEARREANAARRAAYGGDAWDGEGDADRAEDDFLHTGSEPDERDARDEHQETGADFLHHTGMDMEDRDAAGRASMRHAAMDMEDRDAAGARPRGRAGGARGGTSPRGSQPTRGSGPARGRGGRGGGGPEPRGRAVAGARPGRGAPTRGGAVRDAGSGRGSGPRGGAAGGRGPGRSAGERGFGSRGSAGGAGRGAGRGPGRGPARGPGRGAAGERELGPRGAARGPGRGPVKGPARGPGRGGAGDRGLGSRAGAAGGPGRGPGRASARGGAGARGFGSGGGGAGGPGRGTRRGPAWGPVRGAAQGAGRGPAGARVTGPSAPRGGGGPRSGGAGARGAQDRRTGGARGGQGRSFGSKRPTSGRPPRRGR